MYSGLVAMIVVAFAVPAGASRSGPGSDGQDESSGIHTSARLVATASAAAGPSAVWISTARQLAPRGNVLAMRVSAGTNDAAVTTLSVRRHSGAPASFGAVADALADIVAGLDGPLSATATATTSATARPARPTATHTRRFRPLTVAAVVSGRAALCLPIPVPPIARSPSELTPTIRTARKTGMTSFWTVGDQLTAHPRRAN